MNDNDKSSLPYILHAIIFHLLSKCLIHLPELQTLYDELLLIMLSGDENLHSYIISIYFLKSENDNFF